MLNEIYESNTSGPFQVIACEGKFATVKFLETGFCRKAYKVNVKAGKVKDPTYKKPVEVVELQDVFVETSTGTLQILQKFGPKCLVQFLETGFTKEVLYQNAKKGKVRDPYHRSVYGRGYLGEFDKKQFPYWKQASQLWRNMLKRCYSEKDPKAYKGVTVSEDWLCFATFLKDLQTLENFDKWLEGKSGGPKYNLDKDLKIAGNKVYTKLACSFVEESVNKAASWPENFRRHGHIYYR